MPKQSTMCAGNEFYKARIAASSCNDRLSSREGAAEETGIDRTRLARIELGNIIPYPEEVILMAETYDAPQLANHYCSQICPLGKMTVPPAEMRNLDRLTICIVTALGETNRVREMMLEVAKDGRITPDEYDQVKQIAEVLERIEIVAQETKLFITKNLKGGKPNGSKGA